MTQEEIVWELQTMNRYLAEIVESLQWFNELQRERKALERNQ